MTQRDHRLLALQFQPPYLSSPLSRNLIDKQTNIIHHMDVNMVHLCSVEKLGYGI